MKIAFMLYPTKTVKIDEDSSFWMMWELQKRGHKVFYFTGDRLFWNGKTLKAFVSPAKLHLKKGYLDSPAQTASVDLAGFDVIFIRKEPPFNTAYLHTLQLLEMIKDRVFILNDPTGIAMCNEKLFILNFSKHIPETMVTENIQTAKSFVRSLSGPVVIKPLNHKGGIGIFQSSKRDRNLASILETATHDGVEKVMIQRFVSADVYGDKRIVILGGKILGAFIRKPSKADFRANLSAGGTMSKASVTPWDRKLVETMTPKLMDNGLYFVGIDVIGQNLTEVNVTSPAGIPEIRAFTKKRLEVNVADFIEQWAGRTHS